MKLPPKLECITCEHRDDFVAAMESPDGDEWIYTCTSPAHESPLSWPSKMEQPHSGREGICADLGLYEDLEACVLSGEPWVEYGVVEHRYRVLRPATYAKLVEDYHHAAHHDRRYTVSSLLVGVLGQLRKEGILASQVGKPTGFWAKHLGIVSFWSRSPAPPEDSTLTWATYAAGEELAPDVWALP